MTARRLAVRGVSHWSEPADGLDEGEVDVVVLRARPAAIDERFGTEWSGVPLVSEGARKS